MTERRDERAPGTPAGERDILDELSEEIAHDLAEETPPPGGPAYQTVGAAVALAIGVAGMVLSYGYGLGEMTRPGPGLWPFAASTVIAVLSGILLLTGRGLTDSEQFTRSSLQVVVGAITIAAIGALMPAIGFEIPSLLLCVVWLRFLGGESWRSTAVVSVATVAAFYVLFLYALRIPLPHLI